MPAVKGCQSCRRRHDKCVVRADQSVCDGCIHGDRQCIFDNKYRFKAVYHVDTISQGCKTRTNLVYDTDQPWVPTRRPLDIVLENGVDTLSLDTTDFLGHDRLDDQGPLPAATLSKDPKESPFAAHVSAELPPNPGAVSQPGPEDSLSFAKRRPDDSDASLPQGSVTTADVYSPSRAPWLDQIGRQSSHFVELAWSQTSASPLTPSSSVLDQLRPDYYAGEIGALRRQDSNRYTKSPHSTVDSISRKQRTERVFLSYREAFLVQHFIQKIAPWVDCCDSNLAFTREVPRRALRAPMLLRAVLAAAAQHIHLTTHTDGVEAADYHGQCLELLIVALSMRDQPYDDNLLATIVCMRIYEELDDSCDDMLHLQGVRRLLDHMPTFAHTGGLAEAASWQALRQDIYVALHNKARPSFDLEPYRLSKVFDRRDLDAHANVIVLTFARILQAIYSTAGSGNQEYVSKLEQEVGSWQATSLLMFEPLHYAEADLDAERPFPTICFSYPAEVVALQYYHASTVLLLEHKPNDTRISGFEAVKERRNTDAAIVASLLAIVGMAQSNPWVENAFFTAHHLLRTCGYHLQNPVQRESSLQFLHHIQDVMGYGTESTIALLRSQWADLDRSRCD